MSTPGNESGPSYAVELLGLFLADTRGPEDLVLRCVCEEYDAWLVVKGGAGLGEEELQMVVAAAGLSEQASHVEIVQDGPELEQPRSTRLLEPAIILAASELRHFVAELRSCGDEDAAQRFEAEAYELEGQSIPVGERSRRAALRGVFKSITNVRRQRAKFLRAIGSPDAEDAATASATTCDVAAAFHLEEQAEAAALAAAGEDAAP